MLLYILFYNNNKGKDLFLLIVMEKHASRKIKAACTFQIGGEKLV